MPALHAHPSISNTARPGASVQPGGALGNAVAPADATAASVSPGGVVPAGAAPSVRPPDARAAAAAGVVASMPVSAWMQADPAVVPESMSALDLAGFLDTALRRHVFVAGEDGRLTGLVNRARLLRHLVARRLSDGLGPAGLGPDLAVGDLVVRDLVTVSPETPAGDALRTMRHHHVGSLPVVDADGRLVGLVSERLLLPVADAVIAAAAQAPGGSPAPTVSGAPAANAAHSASPPDAAPPTHG